MENNIFADSVIKNLIKHNRTISTMESCTSGLIASMITDVEGASAIFPGGYVTYLNETKMKAGVDSAIIDKYGVYSAECAEAMARTVQKNLGTDIAIGITGTTGNVDPNNTDSVQGEVYYCVLVDDMAHSRNLKMDVAGMSRKEIKQAYADAVFEMIKEIIITD